MTLYLGFTIDKAKIPAKDGNIVTIDGIEGVCFFEITSADQSTSRYISMPGPGGELTNDGALSVSPYHITSGSTWGSVILEAALHQNGAKGFGFIIVNAVTTGVGTGLTPTFKKILWDGLVGSMTRSITSEGVSENYTIYYSKCSHEYFSKDKDNKYVAAGNFAFDLKTHISDSAVDIPSEEIPE